jgi:hypothetical protein
VTTAAAVAAVDRSCPLYDSAGHRHQLLHVLPATAVSTQSNRNISNDKTDDVIVLLCMDYSNNLARPLHTEVI